MKKENYLISILVTNFNKSKFLFETLNSIKKQDYQNFEIIIYDDCSTDNSVEILKKFKIRNKKIILGKKKFSHSAEINQINGLVKCLKISRGSIICLLDGDDKFRKNKLTFINNYFQKNKDINFLINNTINKNINFNPSNKLKLKRSWPVVYPTSCINMKRKFFQNFIKNDFHKNFNLLAIDLRLQFFANLFLKDCFISSKKLSFYIYDLKNNENKYPKYKKKWWVRRLQTFKFLKQIQKKQNQKFSSNTDYLITWIINFFIKKLL